ncbi:hypothetical protein [Deinococcus sp. QL22]|uniref:hypothetical protein n=1 Tax=Deinococcus sp. QL22 TaxID=2939437 RepID=UPI00201787D3|nr:hypothetical protein [Deinococcus sp. QL22]UQN07055.1 hypothetical protein M1R55_03855 [Deinococcus sp. QL22]
MPKIQSLAALLGLSLALSACNSDPIVEPQPQPEVITQPAGPVVGQATEVQNLPMVADQAANTFSEMLNPASADFDPDLAAVLEGFGGVMGAMGQPAQMRSLKLQSPAQLGRQIGAMLAVRSRSGLGTLAATTTLLPRGTWMVGAQGQLTQTSVQPADGYVLMSAGTATTLTAEWEVGGSKTVLIDDSGNLTGVAMRVEVPTNARVTLTRGAVKRAAAQMTMTPGACVSITGPDALTLTAWAGREATSPAQLKFSHVWAALGVTTSAEATYLTRSRRATASMTSSISGSTANRCTPATFAFTPTRADLSASVSVPGNQARADLKLRDLTNVVFSDTELKGSNPFSKVTGTLSASAQHNGKAGLSAFGPLADGTDADLLPGDQTNVQFVLHGKLIVTHLQAVFQGKVALN